MGKQLGILDTVASAKQLDLSEKFKQKPAVLRINFDFVPHASVP